MQFFSRGEPFIHKDFIDIIKNLRQEHRIDILTNLYSNSEHFKKSLEEIGIKPRNIRFIDKTFILPYDLSENDEGVHIQGRNG